MVWSHNARCIGNHHNGNCVRLFRNKVQRKRRRRERAAKIYSSMRKELISSPLSLRTFWYAQSDMSFQLTKEVWSWSMRALISLWYFRSNLVMCAQIRSTGRRIGQKGLRNPVELYWFSHRISISTRGKSKLNQNRPLSFHYRSSLWSLSGWVGWAEGAWDATETRKLPLKPKLNWIPPTEKVETESAHRN